jgi:hypothetical protein
MSVNSATASGNMNIDMNDDEEEMIDYIKRDRLVFYIQEDFTNHVTDKVETDTKCYVLYDEVEDEYFICGTRVKSKELEYSDFKFYCKSKETVVEYLAFVLNPVDSNVSYGFYNFPDLFVNNDVVDYQTLEYQRQDENEIALYLEMPFRRRPIQNLLRMLKEIRY